VFIGIFDAGSNTILQCYLMDKEMGSTDDEPHVPEGLRGFLDEATTKSSPPDNDAEPNQVELANRMD